MVKAGLTGLGSFVPHPPANALWLLPLAGLPPDMAKGLWSGLLVFVFALTAWLLVRLGLDPWLAIVVVLAPTLAVRNALAFGQPYPVLAALLIAGALALRLNQPWLGGFLLGLGVCFKPYALVLGALFLHRDRLRSLAGFTCGVVAPTLLLAALAGPEPFVEFFTRVLPWMARGDIQDPFSLGWASLSSLINRLFRFEPDLNPSPLLDTPLAAAFLRSALACSLIVLGVLCGRRFIERDRPLDAVGAGTAFALAASPFVASYHLVLLAVPVAAVAGRLQGARLASWLCASAVTGSSLILAFRSAEGGLWFLAFARFFALLVLALVVVWPVLNRSMAAAVVAFGAIAGIAALPWGRNAEAWERIDVGSGYSAMRPHFCGEALRWWTPSTDGRSLATQGSGGPCVPDIPTSREGTTVTSRFTEGSWNLYLQTAPDEGEVRLTYSDANEVDPVFSPSGCEVVFASDQGRGLGSLALYRLDVSALMATCEKSELFSAPR